MPPLTETWAVQYLEVVAGLLVFALGIPALVLQLAVPENLRAVSTQKLKRLRWTARAIGVVTATGALAFVWCIHPCSAPHGDGTAAPSAQHGLWANLIMTALIALILGAWWTQTAEYRRNSVIRDLERRCWGSVCRDGQLPEEPFTDLVLLGSQGNPGREKSLTLSAMARLASNVQGQPQPVGGRPAGWVQRKILDPIGRRTRRNHGQGQYTGNRLGKLITGIEDTLTGGGKNGDRDNFLQAAGILENVLVRLQAQGLATAPDAVAALLTLERLGIAALAPKGEANRAPAAFLQAIAYAADGDASAYASERIFTIGATALRDDAHTLHAVAALSKLEALAARATPLRGEIAADLLGLLAHFWSSGPTCQEPDVNVPPMFTRNAPGVFTKNTPPMFTENAPPMFARNGPLVQSPPRELTEQALEPTKGRDFLRQRTHNVDQAWVNSTSCCSRLRS